MEFNRIADIKRLHYIARTLRATLPAGAEVLDVGCGNGVISRSLGSLGFKVKGVDISKKTIARAQELNTWPQVRFAVQSAEQLVAGAEKYHAVICSEVLEHLHNPGSLLQVLHQLLHEDGVLIVTVPNGRGPRELLVTRPVIRLQQSNGWLWRMVQTIKKKLGYQGTTVQSDADDLRHIQFFTRPHLEQLASASRFQIVAFAKTNFVEDVFPFSLLTKRIKILQQLDCAVAELLPYQCTGGFLTTWRKTKAAA